MHTAWSAKRTCRLSRSASEYTATVPIPNSLQAHMTRRAISPRLAIRTFLKGADAKQSLPVLDRLSVAHQLAGYHAGYLRLDLIHQLHRFDDAQHRTRLHGFADSHKGRAPGRAAFVERAHNRRLDQQFVVRRRRWRASSAGRGRSGRGRGRPGGVRFEGGKTHVALSLRPPDAHTVLS